MNTFSIILPVYNGETYIEETLQSVVNALYPEDELIIIDDGSKDGSLLICEKYQSNNVHVYSKVNEGVSKARNYGIQKANKDYILFIDADDLLCEGILKSLHEREFTSDFIIGRTMIHLDNESYNENVIKNLSSFELKDKESIVTDFISAKDNLGIWAVWRHGFKRDFLLQNTIIFDSNYSYAEDMDFILQVLMKANSFAIIDEPFVKYRQYASSVSGQYSLKSMKSHVGVLYKWQNYFMNSQFSVVNKNRMVEKFANKQVAILAHVSHLVSSERQAFFDVFTMSSKFLNQCSGKFKLVYYLGKLIGYETVSKLLGGK